MKKSFLITIILTMVFSFSMISFGASVPNAPEIKVWAFNEKINVMWGKVLDADSYNVKRSESKGGPYTVIGEDITELNYLDTNLTNEKMYYYVVSAVNEEGEGNNSGEVGKKPRKTRIIEIGEHHSIFLKNDGTILTWGYNTAGQLGDGTTVNKNSPFKVKNIENVVEVDSGFSYSMILKSDGTVWTWGYNTYGEIGNDSIGDIILPSRLNGLDNVINIACGGCHNLALRNDGTVWSWGWNKFGQLGDGTTENKSIPRQISLLNNIVKIDAAGQCSIALKEDGTVWTWGYNGWGQLGNGNTTDRNSPSMVEGISNVRDIFAGKNHMFAIKENGTVWSWGYNGAGQLGNGTKTNSSVPVRIDGLDNIIKVYPAERSSLALKSDGTVWSWGSNTFGQLGNNEIEKSCIPIQIKDMNNVVDIGYGSFNGVLIKSNGTIWAWGKNNEYKVGDGTNINRYLPVEIWDLSLTPPMNLVAKADTNSIRLSWEAVENATGYNVKRSTTSSSTYVTIQSNISDTIYIDDTAMENVLYNYVVTAIKNNQESDNSNVASAKIETNTGNPLNLIATAETSSIKLLWEEMENVEGYNVKRGTASGGPYTTIGESITGNSYSDNDVEKDIIYYYIVTVIENGEEIETSNEAYAKIEKSNDENGNALLVITMSSGLEKEYDLAMAEVNEFIDWYNDRTNGNGNNYYIMNKDFNLGPFNSREDYIIFDKILYFEIMRY